VTPEKKFDKFNKIWAEFGIFCEGTMDFCVTNRLAGSTTACVMHDQPPKFTIDGYLRDT
jgi:hypothetical protein